LHFTEKPLTTKVVCKYPVVQAIPILKGPGASGTFFFVFLQSGNRVRIYQTTLMIIITTVKETKAFLSKQRSAGVTIGFVPTMGALHKGHLRLIKQSCAENDITVCSIFVNPIQFNNPEDLKKYPRTLTQDVKMLEEAGCNMVFNPSAEEMYPKGNSGDIDIDFGMLDKVMEGRYRPGHFKGVAIVVNKLFGIVGPTRAYFGKKDFQQLTIIKHMVKALSLPVEIISCETVRESDGLAMSSRNMRLSIAERNLAPRIYEVLCKVKDKLGKQPVREVKEWAIKKLEETSEFRVEYFEIGDKESLLPMDNWSHKDSAVAFTAVNLGDVRLIDNIELFS
jgi:pantoate--beta-alanine ligase